MSAKTYENQLACVKVMSKDKVGPFLRHSVEYLVLEIPEKPQNKITKAVLLMTVDAKKNVIFLAHILQSTRRDS